MRDIDRAIALYDLMAQHLEETGLPSRQAKIYREMIEIMKTCETPEESTLKFKNSKYWTAAGDALAADVADAQRLAAEENGFKGVAAAYAKHVAACDEDPDNAFDTSYVGEVQAEQVKEMRQREAFAQIYRGYLTVRYFAADDIERDSGLNDMRKGFDDLAHLEVEFEEIATNASFRDLITCSDVGYEDFVANARNAASGGYTSPAIDDWGSEIDLAWKDILSNKNAVIEIGKSELAEIKRYAAIAISPSNEEGDYTFDLIMEGE